jgi:1,4-dihydroxy-6-naphthoate synthase
MHLTLGFSPCPNDCFIFDALVHKKIDTQGIDFTIVMDDVEALNQKALNQELDITKLSYHAFFYLIDKYVLLKSGSALGFNCGPLLVKKKSTNIDLLDARVAIPGKYTTANFLLSIAYPQIKHKQEVLFSEIEKNILDETYDAGLLIHENRFTYESKGLEKIADLGEYWENLIHAPIPLGGIVAKRSLDVKIQKTIERLIKESVQYAFQNPGSSMPFVRAHAQEMSEEVMKKHIALYVNDFSLDIGEIGTKAIQLMFNKAIELKLIKPLESSLFIL